MATFHQTKSVSITVPVRAPVIPKSWCFPHYDTIVIHADTGVHPNAAILLTRSSIHKFTMDGKQYLSALVDASGKFIETILLPYDRIDDVKHAMGPITNSRKVIDELL